MVTSQFSFRSEFSTKHWQLVVLVHCCDTALAAKLPLHEWNLGVAHCFNMQCNSCVSNPPLPHGLDGSRRNKCFPGAGCARQDPLINVVIFVQWMVPRWWHGTKHWHNSHDAKGGQKGSFMTTTSLGSASQGIVTLFVTPPWPPQGLWLLKVRMRLQQDKEECRKRDKEPNVWHVLIPFFWNFFMLGGSVNKTGVVCDSSFTCSNAQIVVVKSQKAKFSQKNPRNLFLEKIEQTTNKPAELWEKPLTLTMWVGNGVGVKRREWTVSKRAEAQGTRIRDRDITNHHCHN